MFQSDTIPTTGSVIVLPRTIERSQKVVCETVQTVYQDFTQTTKKLASKICEILRKGNDEEKEIGM
jgi:hypothetical protein